MASSEGSSGGASQLPMSVATDIPAAPSKLSRRQWTLLAITLCLNVLLWTSIFTFIVSLYLVGADPGDSTNVATEILTLISSLTTIAYIFLHTLVAIRHNSWVEQRPELAVVKKTTYVAIRVAVTLCVLWLLTTGWNMITVARQPVCLASSPDLSGWEAGPTCTVGRAGIAMSFIALIASFTLFGILAVVRRPFEAHLFKWNYKDPVQINPTPLPSRRPSRSVSFSSEKSHSRASNHRSIMTESNADVETLDLDSQFQSTATLHSPSPIRSLGLGIFTSEVHPPPLPAEYIPRRSSSTRATSSIPSSGRSSLRGTPPPIFQPSISYNHLPPPPRMSVLVSPSGFVPLSIPRSFSASAWQAVHPPVPSPLGSVASRSFSHLPNTNTQPGNISYSNRHSRSMQSLTRPCRISTTSPTRSTTISSKSGSSNDDGMSISRSSTVSPGPSILMMGGATGIVIPMRRSSNKSSEQSTPTKSKSHLRHIRRSSAPDANMAVEKARWPKGWRPRLEEQKEAFEGPTLRIPVSKANPNYRSIPGSLSSQEDCSASKDSSSDDERKQQFARELELSSGLVKARGLPFRKTRSMSPLRDSEIVSEEVGGMGNGISRAKTVKLVATFPKRGDEEATPTDERSNTSEEGKAATLKRLTMKPLLSMPKIPQA